MGHCFIIKFQRLMNGPARRERKYSGHLETVYIMPLQWETVGRHILQRSSKNEAIMVLVLGATIGTNGVVFFNFGLGGQ